MKSKLTDLAYPDLNHRTQRTRHVGVIVTLTIVLLAVLTVTVWAAWGAARNGGLSAILEARLTATPTKTPRPVTPRPTQIPVDLVIVAPTATSTPGTQPPDRAVATAITSEATPEPLPDYLKRVVAEYGMDPARRFVVVDPGTQLMTIWDPTGSAATGGQSVRQMPVSTGDGTRGYRTPAWYGLVGRYWGTFNAFGVYADEGWYLFEDGGSILLHGAPYKWVDGQRVYQELGALGNYPASRGCIRLSPDDAKWFTAWGPEGVPLVILPTPEDAGVG